MLWLSLLGGLTGRALTVPVLIPVLIPVLPPAHPTGTPRALLSLPAVPQPARGTFPSPSRPFPTHPDPSQPFPAGGSGAAHPPRPRPVPERLLPPGFPGASQRPGRSGRRIPVCVCVYGGEALPAPEPPGAAGRERSVGAGAVRAPPGAASPAAPIPPWKRFRAVPLCSLLLPEGT